MEAERVGKKKKTRKNNRALRGGNLVWSGRFEGRWRRKETDTEREIKEGKNRAGEKGRKTSLKATDGEFELMRVGWGESDSGSRGPRE